MPIAPFFDTIVCRTNCKTPNCVQPGCQQCLARDVNVAANQRQTGCRAQADQRRAVSPSNYLIHSQQQPWEPKNRTTRRKASPKDKETGHRITQAGITAAQYPTPSARLQNK